MDKLRKRFRLLTRETSPTDQVSAVIAAWQAALADYELPSPDDFSLYKIADSGDDGSTALYSVSDRYACWYVVVDGETATLVAFYAYRCDDWCDEEAFAYSEDATEAFERAIAETGAVPSDRQARDALVVKALSAEPAQVEKRGYVPIAKSDVQRYTLGVAYPTSEVDSHGDFTDDDELEQAAWNFMRDVVAKGEGGVGTDHADDTDDAAQVVESYIYRGPSYVVKVGDDEEVEINTGDWLVGAIWTEDAWERVKKGELTGWSIQGLAFVDDAAELEAA